MTETDLTKIVDAIKDCFPNTQAIDGTLLVSTYRYNKLVEVVNEILDKENQVADLP